MTRHILLATMVLLGCARNVPASRSSAGACEYWGGRGFSLTVRSGGSHALQFRELGYDDATGVVRVHDSDLFATGVEAKEPRVTKRTVTLAPADRDSLSNELTAWCPAPEELESAEAMGGGTTMLEVRTAQGTKARARFVPNVGADVARKTFRRLERYFPELRVP